MERTTDENGENRERKGRAAGGWTPILIAFGSNLGETDENIRTAARLLSATPGIRRLRRSSIWRTFPVGGAAGAVGQPIFSNAVATAETTLEPLGLLRRLKKIERDLRRVRGVFWGPRTLDADLILFGDVVWRSKRLTVPHFRAVWRDFVLGPACEIAPDFRFPTTDRTVAEHRALLSWNFASFDLFSRLLRRVALER